MTEGCLRLQRMAQESEQKATHISATSPRVIDNESAAYRDNRRHHPSNMATRTSRSGMGGQERSDCERVAGQTWRCRLGAKEIETSYP